MLRTKVAKQIKDKYKLSLTRLREIDRNTPLEPLLDKPRELSKVIFAYIHEEVKTKKLLKQIKRKAKKETSASFWRDKAWKEFSKYIRHRDAFICFTCGIKLGDKNNTGKILKMGDFHAGHWIEASLLTKYNSMNFDTKNIHCQCSHCNLFYEGNKALYAQRLITKYGAKFIEEANIKFKQQSFKLDAFQLKQIYEYYKDEKNWKKPLDINSLKLYNNGGKLLPF